jgi:hypothetical protein
MPREKGIGLPDVWLYKVPTRRAVKDPDSALKQSPVAGDNSYGFAWADPSGASGYLELLNRPGPGRITLRMKSPHVVVEGPWELPVPVEAASPK